MTQEPFLQPGGSEEAYRADADRRYYESFVANLKNSNANISGSMRGLLDGEARRQAAITNHAEAAADALQRIAGKLRGGASPEDLGRDVELLGRIMARRT